MIVLSGADIVLPDRILTPGTLVIDGDRIAEIRSGAVTGAAAAFAFHGHFILPAFIDVHVHGVGSSDVLDGAGAIAQIADRLPAFGVAAFCPTTVACTPSALRAVLEEVSALRAKPSARAARVLAAHLESQFINPEYSGAQPVECLRSPKEAFSDGAIADATRSAGERFSASEILHEIDRAAPDVGIVTLAPELERALELAAWLHERGIRTSIGHSAATYDQTAAAIAAGVRRATHLFNRMPRFDHRNPGLVGAILQSDEIAAEIICDGVHVHPAAIRTAVAAKSTSRLMAISDGTALSGLPAGATAELGGRAITSRDGASYLADGTLAGSTATMDGVLRMLVRETGLSLVEAATMCATTPARELGLVGHGVLAPDAIADLVVLDADLRVIQTYIAGQLVYARST